MNAVRVAQRNGLVFVKTWKNNIFFSFLQPLMFLTAMGIGLGSLVNEREGTPLGVPYLAFIGPALLAAACFQTVSFESTFPYLAKIAWRRNYEAMLATPLRVADLVVGELMWLALRAALVGGAFLVILYVFRIPATPMAVLAIPCAVLTGIAFGACVMAYAATLTRGQSFNVVFRFIVTPLFLFSGTFFEISQLPLGFRVVAYVTPLFHGVELSRGLILDKISAGDALIHLGYLLGLLAIGGALAYRNLRRRMVT